jgi:hypothetical protein
MLRGALCSTPHKIHSCDQIKKTEMGRESGTYGGRDSCIEGFDGET